MNIQIIKEAIISRRKKTSSSSYMIEEEPLPFFVCEWYRVVKSKNLSESQLKKLQDTAHKTQSYIAAPPHSKYYTDLVFSLCFKNLSGERSIANAPSSREQPDYPYGIHA